MPFIVPSPPTESDCSPTPLKSRGITLATRIWKPSSGKVVALCLLVHGSGWHSGYYAGLAGRLNRDDILVAAFDQVGMGYSQSESGGTSKGYLHVKRFAHWVQDVFAAAVWTKQQAGSAVSQVPFFLMGESLGGLQVLAAALDQRSQRRHEIRIAGVVALGPWLELRLRPSPVQLVLYKMRSVCCPRRLMPNYGAIMAFDDSCVGPEWAATARHDSAVRYTVVPTVGAVLAILSIGTKVTQQAKELTMPLLIIHATNDSRSDCEAVMQFVGKAGRQAEGMWIQNATVYQLLQDHKDVTEVVKDRISHWICTHSSA